MFEKEISAGIRFLDENVPGWYNEINLDELNLQDANYCIIGQLQEKIQEKALWFVMGGFKFQSDLGFYIENQPDYLSLYETLTSEWKKQIKHLQHSLSV